MRIPHVAVRRLVAAAALVASLAACGPQAGGHASQQAGASRAPSAATSPSTAASPSPSSPASGKPSSSSTPKPSRSATAAPSTKPPGNVYASRLPKFGKAPRPERVNLPEGASAAYFTRIPTQQPVAFITIDDGWVKRPEALELLREAGVPVTMFLTINAIKDNPAYFKRLQGAGAVIEAHTITHANLRGKSYDFQRNELCGSADRLASLYGKRPTLFRPPYGEKDATTLKAAHDCGLKAGFFWKETVDKGVVRFQEGHTVQPGDIILMHFRDRFVDDFTATLQAIAAAGLTPARLEDYIPG